MTLEYPPHFDLIAEKAEDAYEFFGWVLGGWYATAMAEASSMQASRERALKNVGLNERPVFMEDMARENEEGLAGAEATLNGPRCEGAKLMEEYYAELYDMAVIDALNHAIRCGRKYIPNIDHPLVAEATSAMPVE